MSSVDIKKKVIEMLSERSGVEENKIKLDSQLNQDIVLDSLSYAELLMEVEEQFDIEIPMEAANDFKSVKDIVDYLENKVNAA